MTPGVGMWIWELATCGGAEACAKKAQEVGLSHVLIKSGDRASRWANQWNRDTLDAFERRGIAVYAWAYLYGDDPIGEANAALWALSVGGAGFVIDAEQEYKGKPDQARTFMEHLRQHAPGAFVAYAPYAIIDYHSTLPYVEFGEGCDAVLPQVYFKEFGQTPRAALDATFAQFTKWGDAWKGQGLDAARPVLPIGQVYRGQNGKTPTPADVRAFTARAREAGATSVSWWSWQHVPTSGVWDAIKEAAALPWSAPRVEDDGENEPAAVPQEVLVSNYIPARQWMQDVPAPREAGTRHKTGYLSGKDFQSYVLVNNCGPAARRFRLFYQDWTLHGEHEVQPWNTLTIVVDHDRPGYDGWLHLVADGPDDFLAQIGEAVQPTVSVVVAHE